MTKKNDQTDKANADYAVEVVDEKKEDSSSVEEAVSDEQKPNADTVEANVADSPAIEEDKSGELKDKLARIGTVIAFSVVLYFEVVYGLMLSVLVCLIAFTLKGEIPEKIADFMHAGAKVLQDTTSFVLFQTEDKPWPLQSWPKQSDKD